MKNQHDSSDQEDVIKRVLQSDRDALEQVLLLRYDWLRSVANKAIPTQFTHKIPSEDVLQEAFVKILRSFEAFHPETEGALFAWLRVVVQNTATDMVRKTGGQRDVNQAEYASARSNESVAEIMASLAVAEDPRASVVARHEELSMAFHSALSELEPRQRQVIELLYFQNYSVSEAADEMGITTDAIRGLRQRARQQIKMTIVRMSHFI